MAALSEPEIAAELAALEITLPSPGLTQLSCYLDLLLRWNQRINLTGIRDPKTIVRRLFGESLCIARAVELRGWLVDVGSGAGFPGLALKLAAPDLRVTLIEARQKKCAFLKQVVLECGFTGVDVVAERFEGWARERPAKANLITTRAVAMDSKLLQAMESVLAPDGKLVVATTTELARGLEGSLVGWTWSPASVPGQGDTVILVGAKL